MTPARRVQHLAVVLLLLVAVAIPTVGHALVAAVENPPPVVVAAAGPIRVVGISRGVLSVREATPTSTPKALPTPVPPPPVPVPPDEGWTGYIVPPPAPTPAATLFAAALRGASAAMLWPVRGVITTFFSSWHLAIDIATACGTPVVAPFSGLVTWAGWRNNGGGNVLEVSHGGRVASLNHLNGFAVTGGQVVAGQVVAYVGATGNATGCHLHFALFEGGVAVNPLTALP